MYVCLCLGVTDRDIQQAIAEGASTVEDVMYCTGAGTRCGSCVETIAAMVMEGAIARESAEPTESGRRALPVLRTTSSAA